MVVVLGPGVIRLKKMETRDKDLALFVDLVSMLGKGSPNTGERQRRINKTQRPAFAERPAIPGGPVIPLAFSCVAALLVAAEGGVCLWNPRAMEQGLAAAVR